MFAGLIRLLKLISETRSTDSALKALINSRKFSVRQIDANLLEINTIITTFAMKLINEQLGLSKIEMEVIEVSYLIINNLIFHSSLIRIDFLRGKNII